MKKLDSALLIESSIEGEMRKVREFQKLQTLKIMANLSCFDEVPEIKRLRKKPNESDHFDLSIEPKPPQISFNRIIRRYHPPYDSSSGEFYGHPMNIYDYPPQEMENLFSPYNRADHHTGKISLAVVCGQKLSIFYGGYPFMNNQMGYFKNALGNIFKRVTVLDELWVSELANKRFVRIDVQFNLPPRIQDVMQLGPRIGNTNNFGILGAEGFFEIYASYRNLDDIHVTKSHFMKFLSAWQTEDYPFYYEPRPLSSFSFELPYGVDAIDIQIRATINAHSNIGNENLEAADNSAIHYSLVDFRSKYDPLDPTPNQPSDYHIISQIVDNVDHTPPGAIEIETISVSTYKIYQNRPDLN